ncbi:hypothetical protein R1flu_016622 [Riccia fluitans]|uniref:Uncharacterized protein n=1 Tax=Riccia fluitans TaxID=41844 RepID=A0ABD1YMC8_9MARC
MAASVDVFTSPTERSVNDILFIDNGVIRAQIPDEFLENSLNKEEIRRFPPIEVDGRLRRITTHDGCRCITSNFNLVNSGFGSSSNLGTSSRRIPSMSLDTVEQEEMEIIVIFVDDKPKGSIKRLPKMNRPVISWSDTITIGLRRITIYIMCKLIMIQRDDMFYSGHSLKL